MSDEYDDMDDDDTEGEYIYTIGAIEDMSKEVLVEELKEAYARIEQYAGLVLAMAKDTEGAAEAMQATPWYRRLGAWNSVAAALAAVSEDLYMFLGLPDKKTRKIMENMAGFMAIEVFRDDDA